MKVRLFLLLGTAMLLAGCPWKTDPVDLYVRYKPVVMNRADFENSIKITEPATMQNAGKIYLKDNWMLLGDTNLGFHLYDNSDPENPKNIAFLQIPGATDLAIRDHIFYVNQAVDLVAFSINTSTKEVTLYKRVRNTFPIKQAPDGYYEYRSDDEVIVNWIER